MKKNKSTYLVLTILLFPFFLNASPVSQKSAEQIAKNYYFEKTDISVEDIKFDNIYIEKNNNDIYYFVFNILNDKGFVIVSAEDMYYPIIGYSDNSSFVIESQPSNVSFWMSQYIEQISYLRNNTTVTSEKIIGLWKKYNVSADKFLKSNIAGKSVDPLAGDILWNQDQGWNDYCPEDGAGPGGHVYAGCVATAMGIVMKYWEYPIHGTGANTYYIYPYGTLSENFSDATYFWNNMDKTSANSFSAYLLYHLGVSVDMGYSADGSGAYSFEVDDALEDHFGYSTDAQYIQRDGYYTETEWINMLKGQIDAGRPVYYSGRDDDDGGHAFVCSGYDDSDLFHYNFGWSGSNNGYYTVNEVGGFHNNQGAVINIHPENSNVYPEAPGSLSCLLDGSDVNNFEVNLEWEAPAVKDVMSYLIYRDFEEIAELNSDVFSYIDNPTPGSYFYSIAAKYTGGDESLTVTDFLKGLFNVTIYAKDPDNGSNIITASVSFNNEVLPTTFVGAKFGNVVFGGDYTYSISHPDYPTTSGSTDVTEDMVINVIMDGSTNKIEKYFKSEIKLYPNPVVNLINLKIPQSEVESVFEIISVSGNTVKSGLIKTEEIINIEELAAGYYILKVTSGSKILSRPFIKK